MKLLLLIMSSRQYEDRQEIIRQTWLKDYKQEYYFYVGNGYDTINNDTIELFCGDKYADLHIKQGMILKYALKNFDFDYIFNCDDNTYVVVDRLLNCGFSNYDYMGHPCFLGQVKYAQGAAGYFISRHAVEKFVETPLDSPIYQFDTIPSDFVVGSILASKNIHLTDNYLFNMGKYIENVGFCNVLPNLRNKYISAHYCDELAMRRVYDHFNGSDDEIVNGYRSRSNRSGLMYFINEVDGEYYIRGEGHPYLELGPFNTAIEAEIAVTEYESKVNE